MKFLLLLTAALVPLVTFAAPVSSEQRTRLRNGQPLLVIVEFDGSAVDLAASNERTRRRLIRDDAAVLAQRAQGYAVIKARVESAASAADAVRVRDYEHFPLALWRLSSLAALNRLESHPSVRMVHENLPLRAVSVSDLPFINQPQTTAEGATGAGTTIAVIDGGLGGNYLNYPDFGTCTAVNTPASTCRVAYNQDFYPGASSETLHGTNVSAIALGVASGAKLAMFDVFNGTNASFADVLTAMNSAITMQATYNIVAISMSLGDSTNNANPCNRSVFVAAVANASNAGITSVAAAGNSGSKSGLSNPACTPGVVSVGAVYDAAYGTVTWTAPADSGGQCTDASAADKVTCFSQSASYLSLLAPGTFVNAPNSSFQQSGTSQATPHVAGSVAVLRARYPTETLSTTVQRLQITGISDTDSQNNLTLPRINLLAATNQGTAVSLSGNGPSTATSGDTSNYTISVANNGPLAATTVRVIDTLPSNAIFLSASAGCTFAAGIVACLAGTLASGTNTIFTITVQWNASGPVYDTAIVSADQINTTAPSVQTLAFGTPPASSSSEDADAPLPFWAYALLGISLFAISTRRNLPKGEC